MLPDLMSPGDVADLLKVPVSTIYRWRAVGGGPKGYRIGKHVRFKTDEVMAWLDEQADRPAVRA